MPATGSVDFIGLEELTPALEGATEARGPDRGRRSEAREELATDDGRLGLSTRTANPTTAL
jgi:hypothetical protein